MPRGLELSLGLEGMTGTPARSECGLQSVVWQQGRVLLVGTRWGGPWCRGRACRSPGRGQHVTANSHGGSHVRRKGKTRVTTCSHLGDVGEEMTAILCSPRNFSLSLKSCP